MRTRTPIAALAVAALATALLVALPSPASAATFTVNSTLDTGDTNLSDGVCSSGFGVCTLRAAVQQANASAGTDVITVPATTITLANELPITSSMQIRGAGARATILTATSGHRNLYVTGGNVEIADLAIQDITTTQPFGAGIHQAGGSVSLTRIRVRNIRVTAANGLSAYGPVLAENGVMSITDSEISGNSTATTNREVYGGGVTTGNAINTSTALRIVNSTIANNTVATSGSYYAMGGGVYGGSNHIVEIDSSTIAGNSASNGIYGVGGNVFAQTQASNTGSFLVKNSILAGGTDTNASGGSCWPANSFSRAIAMSGKNLVDDTTCGPIAAERAIGDAKLRALGNYGGPTDTRPPAGDSPALHAASACASAADQRGQGRPIGPACDLGAVELGASVAVSAALSNTAPSPGADILLTATVTNQGSDTTTGTTVSVSAANGQLLSGGSCSAGGSSASCALPDLPVGGTGTVILPVRAPQSGTASFQVSVTTQQPDPNTADNSATVQATVPVPLAASLTSPSASVSLSSSIPVRWTSAGAVAGFEVQRAVKRPGRALGGYAAWRTLPATTVSTTMTGAAPGCGYCFRVRALGAGGTVSPWSAPRCSTTPADDRLLAGRTGWARGAVRTAYLRTVTFSRVRGATLSLAASRGSTLALVVTKVPGGGSIGVYVRGKRVAVVATAARRAAMKVVIPLRVRTVGYPLVLRVEAPGTRGVTIDGIAELP